MNSYKKWVHELQFFPGFSGLKAHVFDANFLYRNFESRSSGGHTSKQRFNVK